MIFERVIQKERYTMEVNPNEMIFHIFIHAPVTIMYEFVKFDDMEYLTRTFMTACDMYTIHKLINKYDPDAGLLEAPEIRKMI